MNIPADVWPLIFAAVAVFLFAMVRLGIGLQRDPFALVGVVAVALLVLLILGYRNGGVSPLERVNVCTTPTNLAGCPGFSAPVIDPDHDIPETTVPDYRPTPSWAAEPGR